MLNTPDARPGVNEKVMTLAYQLLQFMKTHGRPAFNAALSIAIALDDAPAE